MSGLCVMGLLGRFWQAYTWQGALATLLGGALAGIVVGSNIQWLTFFGNPIIPSVFSALSLGVLVSILTKTHNDESITVANETNIGCLLYTSDAADE